MIAIRLRPALETDSPAIKALIHKVGINPMDLDWRRFIVAVDPQDQIMATGQIKPHKNDIYELASIAVAPEFRGQGLARAMMEYLLKDSPRPLYLTCISSLESLYQKFRFVSIPYEEMPRYFQRLTKLASVMFVFTNANEHLLVMKLQ